MTSVSAVSAKDLKVGDIVAVLWKCGDDCCCNQWRIGTVERLFGDGWWQHSPDWEGEFVCEPDSDEYRTMNAELLEQIKVRTGVRVLENDTYYLDEYPPTEFRA